MTPRLVIIKPSSFLKKNTILIEYRYYRSSKVIPNIKVQTLRVGTGYCSNNLSVHIICSHLLFREIHFFKFITYTLKILVIAFLTKQQGISFLIQILSVAILACSKVTDLKNGAREEADEGKLCGRINHCCSLLYQYLEFLP